MSKFLLKNCMVMVGTTDLSDHAFNIDTPATKEQVDVSGFSPTGSREFLPGLADETITVSFENDFAASSVHATIQPLFTSGGSTLVYVVPDKTAAISATNPAYGGHGMIYEYNGLSGALNARSETVVTFKPAPGSTFAWGTAAPTMEEAASEATTKAK